MNTFPFEIDKAITLLRDNGYHVVPKERVKVLTVSTVLHEQELAYLGTDADLMRYVHSSTARQLASEILAHPEIIYTVTRKPTDYPYLLQQRHSTELAFVVPSRP